MYVLGVDPGKHKCGWALFIGRELDSCGYVDSTSRMYFNHLDKLIMELPQVYPHEARNSKKSNDLIAVTFGGMHFCAPLAADHHIQVTPVYPRDWKGTVDPDVMTDRIKDTLSQQELYFLEHCGVTGSKEHNVVDAIGIVLKEVGRL